MAMPQGSPMSNGSTRLGITLILFICGQGSYFVAYVLVPGGAPPEAFALCLLRTPSTAQSLMFARSGSSWPTPMHHLLYALLATAGSSLKPQRELALQTLASRQQLTMVLRTASHRARYPSVEGWNRSGFTRDCGVPRFR